MRKIFSILVVLMVIGLTFMSCTPTTGNIDSGSYTGTETTASISAVDIPNCGLSYLVLTNGKRLFVPMRLEY